MLPEQYLRSHPVTNTTRLSELRRDYAANGGWPVSRTAFITELVKMGLAVVEKPGSGVFVQPRG